MGGKRTGMTGTSTHAPTIWTGSGPDGSGTRDGDGRTSSSQTNADPSLRQQAGPFRSQYGDATGRQVLAP
jgi:hypothetical protein